MFEVNVCKVKTGNFLPGHFYFIEMFAYSVLSCSAKSRSVIGQLIVGMFWLHGHHSNMNLSCKSALESPRCRSAAQKGKINLNGSQRHFHFKSFYLDKQDGKVLQTKDGRLSGVCVYVEEM